MLIRKATIHDVKSINYIYNQAVLNTTATIDTEPRPIEYQLDWFKKHDDRFAIYVAEENNSVIGWASLSLWSDKCGYKGVAEDSIYIDEKYRDRGAGKKLLNAIIDHAKSNEFHTIIARISDGNDVSVHLHERYGFKLIGTLKELGYKFDKYIDIHIFQLIL
ncbi:GNAT family N-acetyltransferase [Thermoanaerobacterium sp. RBIITD]|uniref:GNAT family N-acetyltransferase n=1 Tax=Thermoanaerobacterium sp. RBIITD TaxID=1550240 RepID=UPI000BB7F44D|nr:GNAT family N-acetyltransferase [Thermoanaerobacterium sp. RBIITD]SNX53902.1 phosphinothricin acetyltransferase [Thermoanaerobacterium sp. RBIITD]